MILGVSEPFSFTQAHTWPHSRVGDRDRVWLTDTASLPEPRRQQRTLHHTPSPGDSIPTAAFFSLIVAYLGIFTPLRELPPLADNGALIGNWQCLPGFRGAASPGCPPPHPELALGGGITAFHLMRVGSVNNL